MTNRSGCSPAQHTGQHLKAPVKTKVESFIPVCLVGSHVSTLFGNCYAWLLRAFVVMALFILLKLFECVSEVALVCLHRLAVVGNIGIGAREFYHEVRLRGPS